MGTKYRKLFSVSIGDNEGEGSLELLECGVPITSEKQDTYLGTWRHYVSSAMTRTKYDSLNG